MKLKKTLVLAAAAGIISLSVGSAHAAKGAGDCSAIILKENGKFFKQATSIMARYCVKAPNATLAAKAAGKLDAKVQKLVIKVNKRITKLDCASNSDPDNPVAPIPGPPPGFAAMIIGGLDEACNGVDDNP